MTPLPSTITRMSRTSRALPADPAQHPCQHIVGTAKQVGSCIHHLLPESDADFMWNGQEMFVK